VTDHTRRPGLELSDRTPVFYSSAPTPCPYLTGRAERRILVALGPRAGQTQLFDDLTEAGFRRNHGLMYRPACPNCSACVPIRIPAAEFRFSRGLRRIHKANRDLTAAIVSNQVTEEQYQLFHRYQAGRHHDGDMAGMTLADYRALVEISPITTALVELRDPAGRLVGCCLFDLIRDGVSAVYSFFDPDLTSRSLGSYLVLWLIDYVRAERLPFVYLGYWIAECRKMSYKIRFAPLEALGRDGWEPMTLPAVSAVAVS
jgi:leucyl-tRNA---protein transferase